jgi:hypothetical protein
VHAGVHLDLNPNKTTPSKPDSGKEELSPRSKMMPKLAEKVNTMNKVISKGCFSKVLPKETKSSSNNTLESKEEESNKQEQRKKIEQKPVQGKNFIPAPPVAPVEKEQKAEQSKKSSFALCKSRDQDDDTTSKQGLSGRKDVVYKTLLRSVKRFYSTEFEIRTEYSTLTKSKQEKQWLKIIDKFTREIFAEYITPEKTQNGEEKETIKGVEFEQISGFMLSLIIPSFIKRNLKNTDTFKTYDTFYEWLYRYSHKRLEAALAIPEVACVFTIFMEGPIFENLLANDVTLSKNQEAYALGKY